MLCHFFCQIDGLAGQMTLFGLSFIRLNASSISCSETLERSILLWKNFPIRAVSNFHYRFLLEMAGLA